ncbi:MAG: hypothetical protein AAFV29_11555, partial [Myxococcota bacterium]
MDLEHANEPVISRTKEAKHILLRLPGGIFNLSKFARARQVDHVEVPSQVQGGGALQAELNQGNVGQAAGGGDGAPVQVGADAAGPQASRAWQQGGPAQLQESLQQATQARQTINRLRTGVRTPGLGNIQGVRQAVNTASDALMEGLGRVHDGVWQLKLEHILAQGPDAPLRREQVAEFERQNKTTFDFENPSHREALVSNLNQAQRTALDEVASLRLGRPEDVVRLKALSEALEEGAGVHVDAMVEAQRQLLAEMLFLELPGLRESVLPPPSTAEGLPPPAAQRQAYTDAKIETLRELGRLDDAGLLSPALMHRFVSAHSSVKTWSASRTLRDRVDAMKHVGALASAA